MVTEAMCPFSMTCGREGKVTDRPGPLRVHAAKSYLKDEVPVPVALRGPKGVDHVGGGVPSKEVGLILHPTEVQLTPLGAGGEGWQGPGGGRGSDRNTQQTGSL